MVKKASPSEGKGDVAPALGKLDPSHPPEWRRPQRPPWSKRISHPGFLPKLEARRFSGSAAGGDPMGLRVLAALMSRSEYRAWFKDGSRLVLHLAVRVVVWISCWLVQG